MRQPDTVEDNDAQTAAEEADVAVKASPPEATSLKLRGRRGLYFVSGLTLICALCATAATAFLWFQYDLFNADLARADTDTGYALQAVRSDLSALDFRLVDLISAHEATSDETNELGNRLDILPGRLLNLEERLNATQGVSEDARRRWLRAEAEYYLGVANAELTLAGRWVNAISALQLADEKLLELANPALSGVRQRIAVELMALRAVRLPDIEGLNFSLGRLAESGGTLPLRTNLPGTFTAGETVLEDAPSGVARVWLSFKSAIAGMVSIERRDETVARSLSTEEQTLLRQQFELELTLGRVALARGQPDAYRDSIETARGLLLRHFDQTAVSVESAIALLGEIAGLTIAPERPDISGSLSLLRGIADRDG